MTPERIRRTAEADIAAVVFAQRLGVAQVELALRVESDLGRRLRRSLPLFPAYSSFHAPDQPERDTCFDIKL
jgi:hypothetical protein